MILTATQSTGAIGFRLDAIKHIDRYFLLDFVREIIALESPRGSIVTNWLAQLKHVRKVTGKEDLFVVAEYWTPK